MEILPSEYQHLELSRSEKLFVRHIMSNEQFGYLLLKTNPAMLPHESMHILLCPDGLLFLKFFEEFANPSQYGIVMPMLIDGLYAQTVNVISAKLCSNKALVDSDRKLRFPINVVYVFPALKREEVSMVGNDTLQEFTGHGCLFKDDLLKMRSNPSEALARVIAFSVVPISPDRFRICEDNLNAILQRIAPEYVTIRVSAVADAKTQAGVDHELLVVTEDDIAVKAFRLDAEQINIVNKISKGDQLILACAGSGKSVLLIAKCFKAAAMNPDKQFLITCYNNNLYSLYTWFIDRAGLRARNVKCLTFHMLCKTLLIKHGFHAAHGKFEEWVRDAIARLNANQISDRFYGIFIDEVQQFESEWYKFCFNLLENRDSEDHLFVICGDKTQKLANLQRHGRAPWNAGEGYPTYRGGNKNIRIERNYRNCIEINEFINRYVSYAKQYLFSIDPQIQLDPDEFLRGKSFFHGGGVTLKHLTDRSNRGEVKMITESIREIHDENGIPYDEIAVIIFNKKYRKKFPEWRDKCYNLERLLMIALIDADIPYCTMYGTDDSWGARYGDDGGVRLIGFQTALGLDFRAAIVCGLLPFGEHEETRNPDWKQLRNDEEKFQEMLKHTQDDIRFLYVACTRAKENLHIILPETGKTSVYVRMLESAE